MTSLETMLRRLRDDGRKALVPYFVAGLSDDWTTYVEAAVLGGADVIEIGIPFSDPMIDGAVIQEAAFRALERGTTFESICHELESLTTSVPLVAMTYYNVFLHHGLARSAGRLHDAGVGGAIVPDLSLEESAPWRAACDAHDVATVFLVAPSTPDSRVATVCDASQGFVYASARMAVTGVASDDGEGERVASSVRATSDVPVYVGIGISTPAQAAVAAASSDGVIVGSALVKLLQNGATTREVELFVQTFRDAIDTASLA